MWTLNGMTKLRPLAALVLRLAVGSAFLLLHGWKKMQTAGGEFDWGASFAARDVAPALLLYIAVYTEVLGGLGLILGFLTRWAALGLLAVMAYAIFQVHLPKGDGFAEMEKAFIFSAGLIGILALGPGGLSVDRFVFGPKVVAD